MDNRATSPGLDDRSRRHLSIILRQVVLVGVICLVTALWAQDPLREYLLLMRQVFGFSALVLTSMATLTRARLSSTSLGIWDHSAALLLMKLSCSLALDLLA